MFGDRPANTRSYDRIKDVADRARRMGQITAHHNFNIVDFIVGPLRFSLSEKLEVLLYDRAEYAVPAFVRYNNKNHITLHVEKSIWAQANNSFGIARYVLAHEIGHILMHSFDELAFSDHTSQMVASLPPEDRTEPQANLFADLFLVPETMLTGFSCQSEIEDFFHVPNECAVRRYEDFVDKNRRKASRSYTGEMCSECTNFTLVRSGTHLRCETCGETTGEAPITVGGPPRSTRPTSS